MNAPARILQAEHANYVAAEYTGKNDSLEHPIGNQIIVKVDDVSDKIGKSGMLYAAETTTKTNAKAVITGVIVAMGAEAFTFAQDRITPWKGRKPQVGDRITFKRYAGEAFQDGRPFQYMADHDVRGIHFTPQEASQ